jgi:hypothetical protein
MPPKLSTPYARVARSFTRRVLHPSRIAQATSVGWEKAPFTRPPMKVQECIYPLTKRRLRQIDEWLGKPAYLRGEWVEMQFQARGTQHELTVCRPYGHCHSYDFIVEYRGRFARVQVKGTATFNGTSFVVSTRSRQGSKPYARDAFEFFAFYIVPMNVWYIIPKSVADHGTCHLALRPHVLQSRYANYMEAWELMKG